MPYDEVMSKYKHGTLRSGSSKGPKVKSRPQAIAIMLSEKRSAAKGKKEYQNSGRPSGSVSHRPRPIKAPKSLAGRRDLAHSKAYGQA